MTPILFINAGVFNASKTLSDSLNKNSPHFSFFRCVPKDEPIDLLNVAFELKPKAPAQPKKR